MPTLQALRALIIVWLSLIAYTAQAAQPALSEADKAYAEKDYVRATTLYENYLKKEEAQANPDALARLHYNLGNCYYRQKDLARAVLHYQRTLRLSPSHADAAFNLQLTQAKLADKFDSPSEMFFVSWFKQLVHSQSGDAWGYWGLAAFVLAIAGFFGYYFGQKLWLRKSCFAAMACMLVLFVLTQGFAYAQTTRYRNLSQAVVMQLVDVYDSPTPSAKKIRSLHEGTTLTLTDTFKGGWLQVEMPDGTSGYLKQQGLEKVAP